MDKETLKIYFDMIKDDSIIEITYKESLNYLGNKKFELIISGNKRSD